MKPVCEECGEIPPDKCCLLLRAEKRKRELAREVAEAARALNLKVPLASSASIKSDIWVEKVKRFVDALRSYDSLGGKDER